MQSKSIAPIFLNGHHSGPMDIQQDHEKNMLVPTMSSNISVFNVSVPIKKNIWISAMIKSNLI